MHDLSPNELSGVDACLAPRCDWREELKSIFRLYN